MQKTINGVTYRTSEKYLVSVWESDAPYMDLYWVRESLYHHPTHGYFLYIQGGSGSRWNKQTGTNTYSAGEHIFPLSEAQVDRWKDMRFNGVFDDTMDILGM